MSTADARTLLDADVMVATRWPSLGRPLLAALVGAAAGKAVIVAETESTASWPRLRSADVAVAGARRRVPEHAEPPMAISIDPRDEEHSLVLALTRLASDAALRASLGSAARAWWAQHATVAHAVEAWRTLLEQARSAAATGPPGRLAPAPRRRWRRVGDLDS